ncbi:MAG: PAS domain S-box protein [Gemmatimonadaceae bacterium]
MPETLGPLSQEETEEARTHRAHLRTLEERQRDRGDSHEWVDVIDALRDAIMVCDERYCIVRANRAYAERARRELPDLIGRPYWECFPTGVGPVASWRPSTDGAFEKEFTLPTREVFASRAITLRHDEGCPANTLYLFREITASRHRDDARVERMTRMQAQVKAVGQISQSPALLRGDVVQLAREITESAARITGVARANVWLFNDDESELRCIDLYETGTALHSAGQLLREAEFHNEFAALKSAPYVDANDPYTDPRTKGYVAGYLTPLRITAMLDAVVAVSGRHLGLLCLEHVDLFHAWTEDEIAFACQLADKIALAVTIGERRVADDKLRASEASLRDALHLAGLGHWTLDVRDGAITWSAEYNRMLGRSPDAAAPPLDEQAALYTAESWHHVEAAMDGCLRTGVPCRVDVEAIRPDGTAWIACQGEVVRDEQGVVIGLRGTALEITERKRAELARDQSERRFRALIEHASDLIVVIDTAGRITFASPSLERLGGFQPDEVIGRELAEFVHPDDLPTAARVVADVIADATTPHHAELRYRRKDGSWIVLASSAQNALGDPGIRGIVVNARDITALKHAEAMAQLSEAHLRAVLEKAQDIIFTVDADGKILSLSAAFERLTGWSADEWIGCSFLSLVHPDDWDRARQAKARTVGGGDTGLLELRMATKAGTYWTGESQAGLLDRDDPRVLVGTIHDITARKRHERHAARLDQLGTILGQIGRGIGQLMDRRELFEATCHVAMTSGGFRAAWIGTFDDEGRMSLVVSEGDCPGPLDRMVAALRRPPTAAPTLPGQLVLGREPLVLDDAVLEHLGIGHTGDAECDRRAVVILPLIRGDTILGALGLFSGDQPRFDDDEVRLLAETAGGIVFFLDHVEMARQLRTSPRTTR